MTLEEYRIECGWSLNEMARKAGVDFNTLKRALDGERISPNTANKLAKAISKELGQNIRAHQINGLNVNL
jgi:transcriptional regulator with XRE-family HTH domain